MKCFVIMPFATEFDDVYATIKSAVASVPGEEVECSRLDEIKSAGRITDDLVRELRRSTVCIADLTANKPNVMWEVGYAMALKKPILFLSQTVKDLPFDIKDMRTIGYDREFLNSTLLGPLSEAFRKTLGTYEVARETTQLSLPKDLGRIIAVTGSMEGDRARCTRRVEALLSPHLGDNVTWLCGSYGLSDEQAVQFLIRHDQKLIVVGYHSYDISDAMLNLVKKHDIAFLDARKEQLPKGLAAPSDRDLFFLGKADLVVLLWDGKSKGTKEIIQWYSFHQKDHVVGFI
jgi:hypothetical protein